MSETNLPRCRACGHRAEHHHGVTKKGYSYPKIACTQEVDRYEMCVCDGYVGVKVPARCTCIPHANPDVLGRPECPVHGIEALHKACELALAYWKTPYNPSYGPDRSASTSRMERAVRALAAALNQPGPAEPDDRKEPS
jgi:hypothetical protein